MSRTHSIFAVTAILATLAVAWRGALNAQTPPTSDIQALMAQLSDIRTIRRETYSQILQLARRNPEARNFVGQMLPDMIKSSTDEPWLNAVRLAGDLKQWRRFPLCKRR